MKVFSKVAMGTGLLILLIFLISYLYNHLVFSLLKNPGNTMKKTNSDIISVTITPTIFFSKEEVIVDWIVISDPRLLELYSNLENKLTSQEAVKKYKCRFLVNSGFFSNSGHIGLFKEKEKLVKNYEENNYFNGFISLDNKNRFSISKEPPLDPLIAVQAGPLLTLSGKPIDIIEENNKNSRRVIAAKLHDESLVFLVFYYKNNSFSGPNLTELSELIKNLKDKKILDIVDAINLDGGKHSVFISDKTKLTEASNVGGFFCVR